MSFFASIRRASIWPLCLLWASLALGATPEGRPGRALEGEAEANAREVAAPLTRSPLDSELIRRPTPGGAAAPAPSALHAPTLELSRAGLALAAVIGLILALRWGGKKLFQQPGANRTTRAVQILARSVLSPRQQILLLQVGRRVIVVGDSGGQMNPLSEITDPDEITALVSQLHDEKTDLSVKAFGSLFGRAKRDMSHDDEEMSEESGAEADPDLPDPAADVALDPAVSETREEITSLMEKIRVMSKHSRGGPT